MEKAYKCVILNTKGGAGKSTVSSQIIAPFLYQLSSYMPVIYEFDDENQESRHFGGSTIFTSERIDVGHRDLRDELTDIMLNNQTACIDVGANKTAKAVMEALIDSRMVYRIDLLVIPLMDGEVDAESAYEVYRAFKEAYPEIKVVFALGRTNVSRDLHCQFDMFLGDRRGIFQKEGAIEQMDPIDRSYFVVPDSDVVKYSRLFGVTVWELATNSKDLDAELKTAIQNSADISFIKLLSFKRGLKNDCEIYLENAIIPAFKVLTNKINEKSGYL
jgi:vacuolar-type H+-ATPase subunit F/Vma7